MKTQHTSGPWTVSRGAQADAFAIESKVKTVATVKHCLESEANARLIAASPMLLGAVQAMLDAATRCDGNDFTQDDIESAMAGLFEAAKEARAAIKASNGL